MDHFEPEQQRYIVMRLACYASVKQVAREVAELYGIEASMSRLMFYNPLTAQGVRDWTTNEELFTETRAEYQAQADAIPIATQIGRLTLMQELLENNDRNPMLAKDLLKQAAMETGGLFQRPDRAASPGGDGGSGDVFSQLSDDELLHNISHLEQRARLSADRSDSAQRFRLVRLTGLRREYLKRLYRLDPEMYAEQVLQVRWWAKQVEVAQALLDHKRVFVKASHSVGKSFLAGGLVNWFFDCFRPPFVSRPRRTRSR